jgi:hypothetical protein
VRGLLSVLDIGGILDEIASKGGIGGVFAVLFAFAIWKLYKDMKQAKDDLAESERKHADKYREAMRETSKAIEETGRTMDKLYEYLLMRR